MEYITSNITMILRLFTLEKVVTIYGVYYL
jgi:hypothetical protein